MDNKKNMTVDEFDLLVRSIHRGYVQDPNCISITGNSLYYRGRPFDPAIGSTDLVSIFVSDNVIWPALHQVEFEVKRPSFWEFKAREKLNSALSMLEEMRNSLQPNGSAEQLICECVPLAKDIIAERALVDDHGNKASNSN